MTCAQGTIAADLFPFTSHYLPLGDHQLHYLDEGDRSQPVLLMVHGNPTWSFYWRNLIREYRKSYRVVSIDHMGCGLSDKPTKYPYNLSQHIENLTRLIETLQLKEINLFVHDWGGAIGMGYAVAHPGKIRSLVVFNTAAFPAQRIPLRISVCRIPILGKLAIQGLNSFAHGATYMATTKKMPPEVRRGYLLPYNTFSHRIANYRFVKDIPMKSSHPSWQRLNEIGAGLTRLQDHPMIILWGEKDWCFDLSFLNTWRERFPAAQVEILADAGHYVVEDASSAIIPLVHRFLRDQNRLAVQHRLEDRNTPK